MGRGGGRHKGGKQRDRQREQRPSFHVFCEGQNTEPLYFKQFPISNIGHCKGYAETKMKLVSRAIKYKGKNRINQKSKDQVWVVFDYDYDGELQPKQKEEYNNAIIKAEKNNINWAVSNDSFELWYVLHFQQCEAQELRAWYNQRLGTYIGEPYDKNRNIAKKMYDLLLPHQEIAIERAGELRERYDDSDHAYADKNPFTTVHELVLELNKYKKTIS